MRGARDKVVMQKTLLRGETTIYGHRVVNSLSVKVKKEGATKYTRTSLRLPHWAAVMQHGLEQYRVGTFASGNDDAEKKGQSDVLEPSFQRGPRCSCGVPQLPDEAMLHSLRAPDAKSLSRGTPEAADAQKPPHVEEPSAGAAAKNPRLTGGQSLGFTNCWRGCAI